MVRYGSQVRPHLRRTFRGVVRNLAMRRALACARDIGKPTCLEDATSPGGGDHEVHRVVGVLQHDCPHLCHLQALSMGVSQGTGEGSRAEAGYQVQVDE